MRFFYSSLLSAFILSYANPSFSGFDVAGCIKIETNKCNKQFKAKMQTNPVDGTQIDLNKDARAGCIDTGTQSCKEASTTSNETESLRKGLGSLDDKEDECETSKNLGHGGCSLTNTIRDVSKGVVAGSDMLGSAQVGIKGSQQVQTLTDQQNSGASVLRQSYQNSADLYDKAASAQNRGAWMNLGASIVMGYRAFMHLNDNKGAIEKGKDTVVVTKNADGTTTKMSSSSVGTRVINKYVVNSGEQANIYIQDGMNEQEEAGGKAMVEAAGFAAGYMNKKRLADENSEAAKMARLNASLIQDPEDPLIDTTPTQTPTDPTTPFVEAQSTPVTKDETLAAKDPAPEEMPDLGAPFNTEPESDKIDAPAPAPFAQSGPPPGGSAGGGTVGGLGGGANSAAAGKHDEEAGARLADSGKNVNYGQAAAGYLPTNRGPAGGNAAPDLSGMLAQFLPKEEDKKNANGILDYKMGGRAPSQSGDESLLGQNENLFLRISEQYARQAKQKRIGI